MIETELNYAPANNYEGAGLLLANTNGAITNLVEFKSCCGTILQPVGICSGGDWDGDSRFQHNNLSAGAEGWNQLHRLVEFGRRDLE